MDNCIAQEATNFAELVFKPGTWERHGVPEAGCRLRTEATHRLGQTGSCKIGLLIHGLMDWLDVTDEPEPALKTLRQLLDRHYPDDGRSEARCHFVPGEGCDHIFDVARQMACAGPNVVWQRRQWTIALAAPSSKPGRMVVSAPAPISLQVATSILSHAQTNFMLEPFDSFEGIRATSRGTGSYYKRKAGQTVLNELHNGSGSTAGRFHTVGSKPADRYSSRWLPPNQLAIQVAIAGDYFH